MKPLGIKSYGSIPHLPGSRQGRDDVGLNPGQARRLLTEPEKGTRVIVQEKLDGSNVAVANLDGALLPITRSGHIATSSSFKQHLLFASWVRSNADKFEFLQPGERLCGEWLAQAHGTRYELMHAPFVPFDIMRNGHERATYEEFVSRVADRLPLPYLIFNSLNATCSIEKALEILGPNGKHGALDPVEGAVWRLEKGSKVMYLAKYVRPDKVDGKYFDQEVWNWQPSKKDEDDDAINRMGMP